jgi:hypothetical protein
MELTDLFCIDVLRETFKTGNRQVSANVGNRNVAVAVLQCLLQNFPG